ncbi:MAG: hypothetical protein ACJAZX_000028 [Rickettsiales bacterium]|jgi:hypothetical protein
MPKEENFQFPEELAALREKLKKTKLLCDFLEEKIMEIEKEHASILKPLFDMIRNPDGKFSIIRIKLKERIDKNDGKEALILAKSFFLRTVLKLLILKMKKIK